MSTIHAVLTRGGSRTCHSRRGRPPLTWGHRPKIFYTFPDKPHEIKEILVRRKGARRERPPLRSATAHNFSEKKIKKISVQRRGCRRAVYYYWWHVVSDYMGNKLYWTDSKLNRIESCSLDGSSRTILMEGLAQPYSLVVYGGDIYWTEWDTFSVKKASLSSPDVTEIVTTQVSNKPTSVLVSFL